ncbi:peptide chain release factor N(5)-glutamine methyltransferase [Rhodobacteraceae bacterium GS-10]|uniref:Release factor glutamine methyltransferase n=1 Tax=Thalassovita mangrovi TaxID=2692236 RepID=A0A6L8LD80_9RHOB|nr:peptide chain release factor N(5)-glutamine methyltransferase [Thalassovita mangrovi]
MKAQTPGQALSIALSEGQDRLADKDNPAREARLLLAHAAGVDQAGLISLGLADFSDAMMERYRGYLDRRAMGEPVSKILGYRDFWNHRFEVSADVLDPRPDTETLIAAALEGVAPKRILDLGTGSGCILLSLLSEWPQATGVGADLSDKALAVAARNAESLGVANRAELILSDWFAAIKGRFDMIVSNPPYISEAEMRDLSPEVLNHDPRMALTPGGDGLDPYRIIAAGAADHLTEGGRILVEIGWKQGPDVAAIFRDAGFHDVEIRADLDGRDRVVLATAG